MRPARRPPLIRQPSCIACNTRSMYTCAKSNRSMPTISSKTGHTAELPIGSDSTTDRDGQLDLHACRCTHGSSNLVCCMDYLRLPIARFPNVETGLRCSTCNLHACMHTCAKNNIRIPTISSKARHTAELPTGIDTNTAMTRQIDLHSCRCTHRSMNLLCGMAITAGLSSAVPPPHLNAKLHFC